MIQTDRLQVELVVGRRCPLSMCFELADLQAWVTLKEMELLNGKHDYSHTLSR